MLFPSTLLTLFPVLSKFSLNVPSSGKAALTAPSRPNPTFIYAPKCSVYLPTSRQGSHCHAYVSISSTRPWFPSVAQSPEQHLSWSHCVFVGDASCRLLGSGAINSAPFTLQASPWDDNTVPTWPGKLQGTCYEALLQKDVEDLLPGATIISFFLERIRRKVRSFWGSISRTVLRAFKMKLCMRLAYCVVVGLSMVLLIGMPM